MNGALDSALAGSLDTVLQGSIRGFDTWVVDKGMMGAANLARS